MMRRISAVTLFAISLVTPCQGVVVDLTSDSLGLASGNYGASLTLDDITITAMTHIGQADESTGTVYVGVNGLGVQTTSESGSSSVSGSGQDSGEALIFDFGYDVTASSVIIGLGDYQSADQPVIRLTSSGGAEMAFDENHLNWGAAVTNMGSHKITVNIGLLLGPDFNEPLRRVSITETANYLYVNSITYKVSSVPEPATLMLLGIGSLIALPLKRK